MVTDRAHVSKEFMARDIKAGAESVNVRNPATPARPHGFATRMA
jgi:hypothetical protein